MPFRSDGLLLRDFALEQMHLRALGCHRGVRVLTKCCRRADPQEPFAFVGQDCDERLWALLFGGGEKSRDTPPCTHSVDHGPPKRFGLQQGHTGARKRFAIVCKNEVACGAHQ